MIYKSFIVSISATLVIMMLILGSAQPATTPNTPTWDILDNPYSGSDVSYKDVRFLNGTHGYVVGVTTEGIGGGVILFTNDSGNSWSEQYHDESQAFRQISIVNQNVIWITGRGGLVYTIDGGLHWINSTPIGSGTSGVSAISFANETHGWTSTNDVLYSSRNSGISWAVVTSWQYNDTARDFYIQGSRIWLIGYFGIYYSSDFGNTWSQQYNQGGWALSFTEGDIGWAVADNMLAHSNNGLIWKSQAVPRRAPFGGFNPPYFSDVLFLTSSIGLLAGLETPISFTPNGGVDWYIQITGTNDVRMNSLDFINETYGWAVGSRGTILRTTKGNFYSSRLWKGLTDYVIVIPILISFIGITSILVIKRHTQSRHRSAKSAQNIITSIEPI